MTPVHNVFAAAAASILLLAAPAAADVPSTKATAQTLFEQGRALAQRGNFAEACPKLAQSLRLDPGIGTMLWLADCYENTGQTASAWATFKEAVAVAAQQQDTREKVARRRSAGLEARLTRVVIVLPSKPWIPGLEVERDGVRVSAAEVGVPIPIDPGIHTLTARAPGHERWSTNIDIPARAETIAVNVPVLASSDDTKTATSDTPNRVHASADGGSGLRTAGIVVAAAGVAAAGVGAFLGLRAKATYDESNEGHCVDDRCDATGRDARSSAFNLATASTIVFAVSAAAIVGGGVLWFTAPRRTGHTGTTVVPAFGIGQASIVLSRSFF